MGSSESRKSTYKNKKCRCTVGVSEAELLATSIGEGVTVLNPDFPEFLLKLNNWEK
jgi:putative heme degradation protein